jgi:hypothetical protein
MPVLWPYWFDQIEITLSSHLAKACRATVAKLASRVAAISSVDMRT